MTDPSQATLHDLHFDFRTRLRLELPDLNLAVHKGDLPLGQFAHSLCATEVLDEAARSAARLPIDDRLSLIQTFGFLVGSLERHSKEIHRGRPGDGIGLLPGLEQSLKSLAGEDLPPRDTALTFWTMNRGSALSFTGTAAERFFNEEVNRINDAQTSANTMMREITRDSALFASSGAVDLTEELAVQAEAVRKTYNDLFRKQNGDYQMPGKFFTIDYRTYLSETKLGKDVWKGPNAAWLPSVFSFDALFGTSRPWYARYARETFRYQTATDRDQLVDDLVGGSIIDSLADVIGAPAGLASITAQDLVDGMVEKLACGQRVLVNLGRAHASIEKAVKSHEQAIRKFLDQILSQLTDTERDGMAVDPGKGTGGGSRDLVYNIGKMRTQNADWMRIREAASLISRVPS